MEKNLPGRLAPGEAVNPAHLFLGTARDNVQDSIRKGRAYIGKTGPSRHPDKHPRGEQSPHAKLTSVQVRKIRASAGRVPVKTLAVRYGVSRGLMYAIIQRRAWKHLE